jgi:hypothetical protein
MTVRLLASANGDILHSEGDLDALYGIASLSKIWAAVLFHRQMTWNNIPLDTQISASVDYEPMIYTRMAARPDLQPPDDALIYRPFRAEKNRFRLPVEKSTRYSIKTLFEAMLFQSKNDAAQALADHFFGNDDNASFREASFSQVADIGLTQTAIGDPHGLNDGDNVTTPREWVAFCAFLVKQGHADFLASFGASRDHSAQVLFEDPRLADTRILCAKTATGNNRRGDDSAFSLMAVVEKNGERRMALALSDKHAFDSVAALLAN